MNTEDGFIEWHRPPVEDGDWNHHIHSIAIGDVRTDVEDFLRDKG